MILTPDLKSDKTLDRKNLKIEQPWVKRTDLVNKIADALNTDRIVMIAGFSRVGKTNDILENVGNEICGKKNGEVRFIGTLGFIGDISRIIEERVPQTPLIIFEDNGEFLDIEKSGDENKLKKVKDGIRCLYKTAKENSVPIMFAMQKTANFEKDIARMKEILDVDFGKIFHIPALLPEEGAQKALENSFAGTGLSFSRDAIGYLVENGLRYLRLLQQFFGLLELLPDEFDYIKAKIFGTGQKKINIDDAKKLLARAVNWGGMTWVMFLNGALRRLSQEEKDVLIKLYKPEKRETALKDPLNKAPIESLEKFGLIEIKENGQVVLPPFPNGYLKERELEYGKSY